MSAFRKVCGAGSIRCDNCNSNDGSIALDEGPVPKLASRLSQFGLRVHERSIPRDAFSKRFPRDEQKPEPFFAGLDRYLVATVEENERAIAGAVRRSGDLAAIISFSARHRRTASMRIRVKGGSHWDVWSSSVLPQ